MVCCCCGEVWSVDHVTHDDPDAFTRDGAAVVSCPCYKERGYERNLSAEARQRLQAARELGTLLGDDVDGYACELEDLGLV